MYEDILKKKPHIGRGSSIALNCPKGCSGEDWHGNTLKLNLEDENWYCAKCDSVYEDGIYVPFSFDTDRPVDPSKGYYTMPVPEFMGDHFDIKKGVKLSKYFACWDLIDFDEMNRELSEMHLSGHMAHYNLAKMFRQTQLVKIESRRISDSASA